MVPHSYLQSHPSYPIRVPLRSIHAQLLYLAGISDEELEFSRQQAEQPALPAPPGHALEKPDYEAAQAALVDAMQRTHVDASLTLEREARDQVPRPPTVKVITQPLLPPSADSGRHEDGPSTVEAIPSLDQAGISGSSLALLLPSLVESPIGESTEVSLACISHPAMARVVVGSRPCPGIDR